MFSVRSTLLAAAAGVALTVGLAVPAFAATGPNSSECINAKAVLSNAQTAQAAAQAQYNAAVKARDAALDAYNEALADSDPTNDAAALATLNSAKDQLLVANLILNERIKAVSTAQSAADTACAEPIPTPTPAPTPTPVGGGLLTCADLAKRGLHDIPIGSVFYRSALDANQDGIACEAPPAVGTVKMVKGVKCHWTGIKWVPVTDPCNCAPTPTPAPTPAPATVVVTQPAPAPQVVTVQSPPQVIEVPSQSGSSFSQIGGTTPAGAAATGDGSLADIVNPVPPVTVAPDGTITVTLDLGGLLKVIQLPAIPTLPL